MPRTKGSDKLHRMLIWLAMNELRNRGYMTHMEVNLPFGFRCDLLGQRRSDGKSEKVVVECCLRPNMNMIKKKRDLLKGYAKLILVMPRTYYDIKIEGVEVWRYDVTLEDARNIISYATAAETYNRNKLYEGGLTR